jgi:hypothetical protein
MASAENTFVIIPTYWTWPSSERGRPVTAAYDHPTPLDSESTLPPLLEDLSSQRARGLRVLILAGITHPDLAEAASKHVRKLLEPFHERLDLRLCDSAALARLIGVIRPNEQEARLIHLGSYSGIRNLQLLVPHILEAEVVLALDDDERIQPDYTVRALMHVGKPVDGAEALGIAGPYQQRTGGVLLQESPPTGNVFHDKARFINAAMQILTRASGGLVPSPMALGGNMLFHRDLFSRVCFDPGITRGEDIDFLINARLEGIHWWFDPGLTILHLPPRHHETPAYQRTREDVFRFIHEREKLRMHGDPRPDWLEPYPGALLTDDLAVQALAALQMDASPELIDRLGDPEHIVTAAQQHARENAARYPEFLAAWRTLMERIGQTQDLRRAAAAAFPRL